MHSLVSVTQCSQPINGAHCCIRVGARRTFAELVVVFPHPGLGRAGYHRQRQTAVVRVDHCESRSHSTAQHSTAQHWAMSETDSARQPSGSVPQLAVRRNCQPYCTCSTTQLMPFGHEFSRFDAIERGFSPMECSESRWRRTQRRSRWQTAPAATGTLQHNTPLKSATEARLKTNESEPSSTWPSKLLLAADGMEQPI